jgi:membrane glycosyltransferase
MGFACLLRGDAHALPVEGLAAQSIDAGARTAVLVPICNEDIATVFGGLRATCDSLRATGHAQLFDVFVLSDTRDGALRAAGQQAWQQLSEQMAEDGTPLRVFYRWRRRRTKRKAGNVADFCRRWGRNYRYMVILDADSVMSGECLGELVRRMEADPAAGILQTAPRAAGRETLYARAQQFAGRVYGPLFTAGMHYWQLGEAHYWGHNAIIRLAPFMRHCAVPGDILSHDFAEAALMRRAGYGVWIAWDLEGSYEEMPPSLLDELKRDRRWCRGNLINARFIVAPGIHPAHRAMFLTGVMAYLSAPLWFLFLLLTTALLAQHVLVPPSYFVEPRQLFPRWPEWNLAWALGLLTATAVLLFVPKLLAVLRAAWRGAQRYGGALRLGLALCDCCSSFHRFRLRFGFGFGFRLRRRWFRSRFRCGGCGHPGLCWQAGDHRCLDRKTLADWRWRAIPEPGAGKPGHHGLARTTPSDHESEGCRKDERQRGCTGGGNHER